MEKGAIPEDGPKTSERSRGERARRKWADSARFRRSASTVRDRGDRASCSARAFRGLMWAPVRDRLDGLAAAACLEECSPWRALPSRKTALCAPCALARSRVACEGDTPGRCWPLAGAAHSSGRAGSGQTVALIMGRCRPLADTHVQCHKRGASWRPHRTDAFDRPAPWCHCRGLDWRRLHALKGKNQCQVAVEARQEGAGAPVPTPTQNAHRPQEKRTQSNRKYPLNPQGASVPTSLSGACRR